MEKKNQAASTWMLLWAFVSYELLISIRFGFNSCLLGFTADSPIFCLFLCCLPTCSSQLLWWSSLTGSDVTSATHAPSPLDAVFQLLGDRRVTLSRGLLRCSATLRARPCVCGSAADDLLCESRPEHTPVQLRTRADVSGRETRGDE